MTTAFLVVSIAKIVQCGSEGMFMQKCRVRGVQSTEFKLWCFCLDKCWFESPAVTLNHCFRPLDRTM